MTAEKKPGPWGQNPDIDKVTEQKQEKTRASYEQMFRDAGKLAEDLREIVQRGGEDAAYLAFDTLFFPENLTRYGTRPDIERGLREAILTEIGEKHGWDIVTKMLVKRGLDKAGPLLQALERNGKDWKKA